MDNIIKDLLSLKWLICLMVLKDFIMGYFMLVLYQRTKNTHRKMNAQDKVLKRYVLTSKLRGKG